MENVIAIQENRDANEACANREVRVTGLPVGVL